MRAAGVLAGLVLILLLTGSASAAGTGTVLARLGPIAVSASPLRPGPDGTLTASLQISTSAWRSDQLDVAIAADGEAVAVYHQLVGLIDLSDLSSCGSVAPPEAVIDNWLHYGPLPLPGRSGGLSPPTTATLTVRPVPSLSPGAVLVITLYFARAGSVPLRLPVSQT